MFGTVSKRESDGLFTAELKSVESSSKTNFTENIVPNEKVGMNDTDLLTYCGIRRWPTTVTLQLSR